MPNESTGNSGSMDPVETRADKGRLLARRYRLGKPVGRGGMGTVWQAHDEVLGRDVAVKEVILPHGLSDDERAVQYKRTFREARTAARLAHPGVVTVYDVVEEDGRPWIIMELIESKSLDQVIKQEGLLSPGRAAEIGRQMLAALHAAHEAGVLHRDVKPSNVLVGQGDRAVLTDFGIATATGDVTLTQTGLVMGSPAYIAPERARGLTIGPASDLWSLGITLQAMVDGRSPYDRPEPMASLVAIISEEPRPPVNAGPLAPVIAGLLRKDPEERMSAQEAGMLLDEIVRAEAETRQLKRPGTMSADAPAGPAEQAMPAAAAAEGKTVVAPKGGVPPWAARTGDGTRTADGTDDAFGVGAAVPPAYVADRPPREPRRAGEPRIRVTTGSVIAAIIGIALLALALVALREAGTDDKAGTRSNISGTGQRRGASASKSAKDTSTGSAKPSATGVPEGFRPYTGNGFTMVVPKDWSGPDQRSNGVFFFSPDRAGYLQIDQTSSPGASALEDWRRMDKKGPQNFRGYKLIKLAPVAEGEPVADRTGKKSADWEFTYGPGPTHVLDRGFVIGGRGFAILLSAPDRNWHATFARLAPVYASFAPA